MRAGKGKRVVLLFVHVVYADGELVRRAERLNARQADVFLFAQRAKLRRDLLAAVKASNDRIFKTFVVHDLHLLKVEYILYYSRLTSVNQGCQDGCKAV